MFKKQDYIKFESIISKLLKLEDINRQIDENKLSKLSSLKNELVLEFISTNNIEGDVISFDAAKKFLTNKLNENELSKRWIGIKYAHEIVWSNEFAFNIEYIQEAHRALMRFAKETGGIWKTKINQVGSLVTAHPDDVPKMMFDLLTTYITSKQSENPSCFNIIPMVSEFLAIHPYEDGNGRMSRLLMNREFYDAGYKFVKYVSISKFLWENKKEYIEALEKRNLAWASKKLNPTHLVDLFNVIINALLSASIWALENQNKREFKKEEFKKNVLKILINPLSISEIIKELNIGNSKSSISKWLKEMIKEKIIMLEGNLKSSKYKKIF